MLGSPKILKIVWAINHKCSKRLPVKTAQPAAAASEMLCPAKPGKNDPPITAIGVNIYKLLSSPAINIGTAD